MTYIAKLEKEETDRFSKCVLERYRQIMKYLGNGYVKFTESSYAYSSDIERDEKICELFKDFGYNKSSYKTEVVEIPLACDGCVLCNNGENSCVDERTYGTLHIA